MEITMKANFLFVLMLIVLSISLVLAFPQIIINFPSTSPFYTTNISVEMNLSITEQNLGSLHYNWNGTNYTLFNDSLVLMYNFDNISSLGENSTYVVDISNKSNNGTAYNGTLWNSSGKYNGAYQFDGINDYISLGNPFSLQFPGTTQRTISAWVKLNSVSTSWITAISGDAVGSAALYRIQLDNTASPNRKFAFVIKNSAGIDQVLRSSISVSTGIWYYITGVYTGTQMVLYVNGAQSGTPITMTPSSSALSEVVIGDNSGRNYGQMWNGSIDEVRIWNRSLSADEVYQQYASNLQKFNQTQWYLYVNQSKNATTGLDYGSYTYQIFTTNSSGSLNSTEQRIIKIQSDITYPIFSNYSDNNDSLSGSGTALFNATNH